MIKKGIILIFLFPFLGSSQSKIYDSFQQIMGVDFLISVVDSDSIRAFQQIDYSVQEARKIENTISSWIPHSQTSKINKNAGISPVKVDVELFELIERAKRVSKLTNGVFDITIDPLISVWKIDSIHTSIPSSEQIQQAKKLVNYQEIQLDKKNQTVFLPKKGMSVGFGGIGKGFVGEFLKVKLIKRGVNSGMISAGGDIIVWGNHPEQELWSIGIANPSEKNTLLGYLKVKNNSVVTSGNYEKYIEIHGKRYTHIINPQTGFPVEGLKSVTVVCANAELADALATACFVMGTEKGLKLINQLKDVEALFVNQEDKIFSTSGLKLSQNE